MENKQYVVITDTQGNENIWCIEREIDGLYLIHTRDTYDHIEKDKCLVKYDSILFYYEHRCIDILPSSIELETEEEYEEWLESQNENINPFRVFDEVDWGMDEPDNYGLEYYEKYMEEICQDQD